MPAAWQNREVRSHSGKFRDMGRLLRDRNSVALFEKEWLPRLLETFAEPVPGGRFRLIGRELSLEIGGTWAYCQSCRTAQRPFPGRQTCVHCGHEAAEPIDPDTDQVFVAPKGLLPGKHIRDATGATFISDGSDRSGAYGTD